MEHSGLVDQTLGIYRRLRADGRDAVGTVLQSYLYRTPADLAAAAARAQPATREGRLSRAARTSPTRARRTSTRPTRGWSRPASRAAATRPIATHDERLIEQSIALAERMGIGRDRFEFQMLYGVRSALQLALVARGFKVLVATPFGPQWYPYLMRRLAERPANVLFVARNLVRR